MISNASHLIYDYCRCFLQLINLQRIENWIVGTIEGTNVRRLEIFLGESGRPLSKFSGSPEYETMNCSAVKVKVVGVISILKLQHNR